MPILCYIPQDPTDTVLQGEQLRIANADARENYPGNVVLVDGPARLSTVIQDEDPLFPMNSMIEGNRLSIRRAKDGGLQVRNNAGIATPCGAWVTIDYSPLIMLYLQATERFAIVGITRDSAGAALSGCDVIAFEPGKMVYQGAPFVGQTTSDGSGNYTIPTAGNGAHQVIAYKSGPVAGISLNTLTPTQV
jgi:hypothetical protein